VKEEICSLIEPHKYTEIPEEELCAP
jgi:hypothetical protein